MNELSRAQKLGARADRAVARKVDRKTQRALSRNPNRDPNAVRQRKQLKVASAISAGRGGRAGDKVRAAQNYAQSNAAAIRSQALGPTQAAASAERSAFNQQNAQTLAAMGQQTAQQSALQNRSTAYAQPTSPTMGFKKGGFLSGGTKAPVQGIKK